MKTFSEALAAVADIASHWVGRTLRTTTRRLAVRRDDLEQAARIGTWKAWQSFRDGLSSWRTWASKWIRAYVEREAWGSQAQRRSPKFAARLSMRSLDKRFERRQRDGQEKTLGDLQSSPLPSPERIASDRETLAIVRHALLRGTRDRKVRVMALAYVAGESMPSIAARRGSSIQAVSQQLRPRLLAARAAWEACR